MVLRPVLAGAYALGQRQRCSAIVNRSIRSSMYYAACVVVVLTCLSRPLVTGLFTERFAYSADLLVLFLPLVVMRSLGAVILPGLIAAERAGTYARLTLVGAVLNFILNLILIPHWHAKGAVVSTLLSYLPIEVMGLKALAGVIPGYWRRGDTVTGLKIGATGAALTILYVCFIPQPVTLSFAITHAVAIVGVFTGALLAVRAIATEEVTNLIRPCLRMFRGG
jgi:O-antigen/teichoic acid export membrane protein